MTATVLLKIVVRMWARPDSSVFYFIRHLPVDRWSESLTPELHWSLSLLSTQDFLHLLRICDYVVHLESLWEGLVLQVVWLTPQNHQGEMHNLTFDASWFFPSMQTCTNKPLFGVIDTPVQKKSLSSCLWSIKNSSNSRSVIMWPKQVWL